MPTYDYRCDACAHTFEEFQSFSEKQLKKCPQCGKSKLRRLLGTGAAILFKGSGFYQTDYRSEGYKSAAKAEESKNAPPADSSSSKGTASKSDGNSPPASPSEGGKGKNTKSKNG